MSESSKRDEMKAITKISKYVTRILGQNPSPFTLQGTNTYLIGAKAPFILVDTAQGIPEYIPLLESVISPFKTENTPLISDILLTHWHGDHVKGLPDVLELLRRLQPQSAAPKVHKFPPNDRFSAEDVGTFDTKTLLDLSNGQAFNVTLEKDQSEQKKLEILHTPGHTVDSISLALQDEGILTADTVLGQGTAVFENLTQYMHSLELLKQRFATETSNGQCALFPGHGPMHSTGDALKWVEYYLSHRVEREKSIIAALKHFATPVKLQQLTNKVYEKEKLSPEVFKAACRGVLQYLEKLIGEGKVQCREQSGEKEYSLASAKM